MAERVVDRPDFDEYVAARGGDLLRTAWLLVGDDREAERLVRTALARAWPQWSHLAERGAGSYDLDLRRFLAQAHLRRHRHGGHPDDGHRDDARPDDRRPDGDRFGSTAAQEDSPLGGRRAQGFLALEPLDALSRVERTVVVLVLFDGLSERHVADLLDDDEGSVRRHLVHAQARLRDGFGLDERGVRGLLHSLAPDDPPIDALLTREGGYAGRWRGVRGWAFAVVVLAVTALVVAFLPRQLGADLPSPGPSTRATPSLDAAAATCRNSGPPAPPRPLERQLSARYAGVLVCAQTDNGSVWSGALPPDNPVTDPAALDTLALTPRGSGPACPDLPDGPAFRLLLLGRDGTTTTWANEGLACDGWPALAQVYVATAEQAAKAAPPDVGFLGCPTALGPHPARTGTGQRLSRGTVLVEATACLHPLAQTRPPTIPKYRAVRGNVLGTPDLAQLNAELARSGSRPGGAADCTQGPGRYVIRARTDTGRLVELSSICGRVFTVDGNPDDLWTVRADTTSMLRALLIAN